ncbi:pyridoxamine 5'-phosphate oxidase family protein [Nocardia pseudobrasiliensis]|uniref:Pyridoxamine 5'-phosphate oxidase n=1 Tax=Nocardia pseudobrasiliensis TaxID=45979 RepID=A0A370I438_9NOCA|nr:pyridoxamine 5'-phosphate oxidase family protein [Nocardia pseudobrasiliensis]RDI65502.1 pyridoxamine 5'-phosphate oxidase [Nocardia pseudobrasiliensis]
MQFETTNLDIYGHDPLPWSRARDALDGFAAEPGKPVFLSTCRPDGRPHTAGVGALWLDGGVYIVSGPSTRKSRNLAVNPACTVTFSLPGLDLVIEGDAAVVTDTPTLERIAARYRELGWPVEVDGRAFTAPYSAPSAGTPPWQLYFVTPRAAVGVASAEPHGATRWHFG